MRSENSWRLSLLMTLLALVGCGAGPESDTGAESQERSAAVQAGSRAQTRWVLQSHGFDDERANAVAIDRAGNIIVLASFRHVADFGTGLVAAPSPQAFNLALVKYRWDGMPLWVKVFGTAPGFTGDVSARSLAVDLEGNIVFAGENPSFIDFGGGLIPEGGFLVKLDPMGNHLWSRSLHVEFNLFNRGLVIDRTGHISLAGSFEGILDFGTGRLPSASWSDGPANSAFLARFNPQGQTLWVYVHSSPSDGMGLAVENDGDLILSGWWAVEHRVFGIPFVIKFNPRGSPIWEQSLINTRGFFPQVAVQGGTVVAMGHFAQPLWFAGQWVYPRGRGMLLATFANGDSTQLWARSFDAEGRGLSVNDDGALVTGAYSDGADLGLGPLQGAPGSPPYNVFVARYHRLTGVPRWTRGYIATGIAEVADIATTGTGESVIGGSFRDGTVNFGTGSLVPESRDMFLFNLSR